MERLSDDRDIALNKEISRRFWITRFFMIIGIVILHVPPYQPLSEVGSSFFGLIKAFFSHGFFRATVPTLTVVSGYLVFYHQLHLDPVRLVKKKAASILVPLIVWNIPVAIGVFVSQKYQLLPHAFSAQLYPFELMNWVNALTGLFSGPVNYPLNFLRDLFVISLMAPLMWPLINRVPYIGLVLVSLLAYFNVDGDLVLRNSMLVNFYVGGLAVSRKWDLTALDRYAVWLLVVLISCCAAIVALKVENRELFRVVSPFLVWPCMRLIVDTRFGDWLYRYAECSFFIYLTHSVVLLVLWVAFQRSPLVSAYGVYWLIAPPVTVLSLISLCQEFKKRAPRLAGVVLGGRS